MNLQVFPTKTAMGAAAAAAGVQRINTAIAAHGQATIIIATGTSQFEMLDALVKSTVDFSKVTVFHLDEYVGLAQTHPASFRRYLVERFWNHLPQLRRFHLIAGDAPDPAAECRRLGELIGDHEVAVAFVGIGENGHLAFNDPPADFETTEPYIVVQLDAACRRQQLGEGWFPTFDAVPTAAISMSVSQIMKSQALVVTVPDQRKAAAVRDAVGGPVTNNCPASIVQTHADCSLFLDTEAASLIGS